jgi:hypothetical protein
MAFDPRTKDNPGDVGRSADQNQSIDNENFLYAGLFGPVPDSQPPGVMRAWVQKTGMNDDIATEVFTITTTNEGGDADGGVYGVFVEAIAQHVGGAAGDNAVYAGRYHFARAMKSTGVGQNAPVVEAGESGPAESEGGTTKGISAVTMSVVETSEYVQSVRFQVNLDGTTVTSASVFALVTLVYASFTTPPVITSAG